MKKTALHIVFVAAVLALAACSTKKNTSGTRFYHAMTARFNTFYNGNEAYKSGVLEQEKAHVDNYNELLPMFISRNKKTSTTGEGSFKTAIEKCEKAIKQHSIKARPATNVNKKKTAADKAYLARKEFNPFLKHAWMLMGKAQFRQGQFIEAASTFQYITQIYATQPEVLADAYAWLARCYVQLDWPYDAENLFTRIQRDSLAKYGTRERDASYADYLIQTHQYKETVPYLISAIKNEKSKKQKARLNYLLAQVYELNGEPALAYNALRKVIRSNPPYELELSARVKQSEVSPKGQYQQMVKKLRRMAKSQKNKDYLDQIYYALGNVYLSVQDTVHCISAYEQGAQKSTRNGVAKANVLLHLAQLYWEMEDYVEAQRCYADLIGILDKEHQDFAESERRAKILEALAPHVAAVELQDSLQELARMPEKERNAAIDRVIEALIKKEKEEAKEQAQQNAANNQPATGATGNTQQTTGPTGNQTGIGGMGADRGSWYFYNPMLVQQGKSQFQRTWGRRKLEDNWRRSDKSTSNNNEFEEYNYDEDAAQNDSVTTDSIATETAPEELNDSAANDPHKREFYLKQIPFTPEQIAASDAIIGDGLYQAGVIEMVDLNNYPLAQRTLLRALNDYPDYVEMDMLYYQLFLLYRRMNRPEEAEVYRQKLIAEYPQNRFAQTLANPNYELFAREGRALEDSLYAATYGLYEANNYAAVLENFRKEQTDFPEGAHYPKFLYLKAMSELYTGERDSFLVSLRTLIQKYPKEELTEMASAIVKGVEEGRALNNSKFDAGSIWSRRGMALAADSTGGQDTLSTERYCNFVFLMAYPKNSLNEDRLLYELARYNFSSFLVRNFDIEVTEDNEIGEMIVRGFLSFDEAHAYTQKLYTNPTMSEILKKVRVILISEENLKLLGKAFSFDDYAAFYEKHFAPLQIKEDLRLDEPSEIRIRTEEDFPGTENGETEDKYNEDEYGYDY